LLIKQPVLTVGILASSLGVSFPAANKALQSLIHHRVVRERTGRARDRIYAAEEVLAVLGRPFGDSPNIALEHARRFLASGVGMDGKK
jgi:hypothetical protein